MWQQAAGRRRVEKELQILCEFLIECFGNDLQKIVVFGSYLRWSFRTDSDVDVAVVLRNSREWQWSKSESRWERHDDSPHREAFFQTLAQFLKERGFSRPYDITVFTARDLELLEEFQDRVLKWGKVVPGIRSGRVLFRKKGENDGSKKGPQELRGVLGQGTSCARIDALVR